MIVYVVKNLLNGRYIRFNKDSFEEVDNRIDATVAEGPIYGVSLLQKLCSDFGLDLRIYGIRGCFGDVTNSKEELK